jgi:hypothetical protein
MEVILSMSNGCLHEMEIEALEKFIVGKASIEDLVPEWLGW